MDGANLVAFIDPEKVEYNTENYYLVDIDLLEFFGVILCTRLEHIEIMVSKRRI